MESPEGSARSGQRGGPGAWTERAGRAGGAAGPGGRSAEPDKGSWSCVLALGGRGQGAPRRRCETLRRVQLGRSPSPAGESPRAPTCPTRFSPGLGICRGDLSCSGKHRGPEVRRAPAGPGARERRKFPSRVRGRGAGQRASPACSARDPAGCLRAWAATGARSDGRAAPAAASAAELRCSRCYWCF